MVRAAVLGGSPEDAFRFFATGVFTILLGLAAWRTWLWTSATTTRRAPTDAPVPEGPEQRRHRGFSGEDHAPTRW